MLGRRSGKISTRNLHARPQDSMIERLMSVTEASVNQVAPATLVLGDGRGRSEHNSRVSFQTTLERSA